MSDYYVDATAGDDSNDGLGEATAWKTIARANGQAFANDGLLFKRGLTWAEHLIIVSSGYAGDPFTVGAYGSGPKPIITGNLANGCITVRGASRVAIRDIHVKEANWYCLKIEGGSSHVSVDNVEASDSAKFGIQIYDEQGAVGRYLSITNCLVHGNQEHGIGILEQNHDIEIIGNECYGNCLNPNTQLAAGIKLKSDDDARCDNVRIYGNRCHDNGKNGMYLDSPGPGLDVRYNECRDNGKAGLVLEWTADNGAVIMFNACLANGEDGLSLWRRSSHNLIANNVIADNGRHGMFLSGENPDPLGMHNNQILNNIAVDNAGEQCHKSMGMANDGTNGSGNVYEDNLLGWFDAGLQQMPPFNVALDAKVT